MCVRAFTCVRFMQVALQATHIGRFERAEFAPEGLVVAVVRLHVSVQAGDDEKKNANIKKNRS